MALGRSAIMKRIDAIIRSHCLESVKDRLAEIGICGFTVAEVKGFGREKGRAIYRGVEYTLDFLPKNLVIIIAEDEQAPEIIDAIIAGARSGKVGDGRIFVTAIEEVVRIDPGVDLARLRKGKNESVVQPAGSPNGGLDVQRQ